MRVFLLALPVLALFAGCATTETEESPAASSSVSSLPWNRPENWETGGAIPGIGALDSDRR